MQSEEANCKPAFMRCAYFPAPPGFHLQVRGMSVRAAPRDGDPQVDRAEERLLVPLKRNP